MLDYKLLEAMAMVVESGGFEKAARRLHVTQSAVSQRIKLLEEMVGQVLLARRSPPEPTPAARRLMKHYHQVRHLEGDLVSHIFPQCDGSYGSLAVGINADSLSTWFMDAASPFMETEPVVLDLKVDDQDETHKLLRDGEVAGCVSSLDTPVKGCDMTPLGSMAYRMLSTPSFAARWFPGGMNAESVSRAPMVLFNRKDELQSRFFKEVFGGVPSMGPVHYVPSSEQFLTMVTKGLGFGMVPDLQGLPFIESGKIVELCSSHRLAVSLYWHAWKVKSGLLERFSRALIAGANNILEPII